MGTEQLGSSSSSGPLRGCRSQRLTPHQTTPGPRHWGYKRPAAQMGLGSAISRCKQRGGGPARAGSRQSGSATRYQQARPICYSLIYSISTASGVTIIVLYAPGAFMQYSSHPCLVDPVQRNMLFWAEHCRSQPSAIRESMPVVSGFTLVPTFSNPSCATIRRKLLQKAPRGEAPLLACRLPVSEEKTATNERDCNRNEQGSSASRLSGSSDLPNYFPATRNAKKETGCVGARQRRPSAPSVGLQIAQGWTSMAFVSIPSSARGGVVGWSDRR